MELMQRYGPDADRRMVAYVVFSCVSHQRTAMAIKIWQGVVRDFSMPTAIPQKQHVGVEGGLWFSPSRVFPGFPWFRRRFYLVFPWFSLGFALVFLWFKNSRKPEKD